MPRRLKSCLDCERCGSYERRARPGARGLKNPSLPKGEGEEKGTKMKDGNESTKKGTMAGVLAGATTLSFTITIICWSLFELLPDWSGAGTIATGEAVRDIWVSLAICLCMSLWGCACFCEKAAVRFPKAARIIAFGIGGYAIIAGWVFGSGWCSMRGFALFTIICVAALAFSCIITFICMNAADKRLNERLGEFKDE